MSPMRKMTHERATHQLMKKKETRQVMSMMKADDQEGRLGGNPPGGRLRNTIAHIYPYKSGVHTVCLGERTDTHIEPGKEDAMKIAG